MLQAVLPDKNSQCDSSQISKHTADIITGLFDCIFLVSHKTSLIGGSDEPLYQPGSIDKEPHKIFFTRDYFASALHEVAHWCVAGKERRQQVDYGYWYLPDGRNTEQQRLFEKVEVKPQALEWVFCTAAAFPFRLSVDNLNGSASASEEFKNNVWSQTQTYCQRGLPARARLFAEALQGTFCGQDYLKPSNYCLEALT